MKPPKVLRVTLAVGLSSLLVTGYSGNIASAETKSQLQDRLESVQKKQKNNTNDLNDSKEQLNENDRQQDNLAERIQTSQTKIQQLSSGIQLKQKEVAKNQADMSQLKNEIVKITKRIEKRDSLLRGRLRSIYINGGAISYIDVIMGSKSFGNFLDRLLALKTITDQDNNIINAQKKDKEAQLENKQLLQVKLEKTKKGLENLVSLKSQLDREQKRQKSMLAQLKVKETEINDTVMSKNEQADILAAQASVIKQQMGDLDREEARKKAEEEKKKADAAAKAQTAQTQSDSSSAGSAANNGSKKTVQSAPGQLSRPSRPH
ncbi:hypothetical protein ABNN70_12315 [Sporolactobacillus sp. Y61]|uniref:Peptidoglycan hydrolase PcsB coiled-coil domain-containing protein n=1 Tax=Sporolactobacillus sp. Y61 TaxID=3160863 RepID=A0AAU8IDX9_9BACL